MGYSNGSVFWGRRTFQLWAFSLINISFFSAYAITPEVNKNSSIPDSQLIQSWQNEMSEKLGINFSPRNDAIETLEKTIRSNLKRTQLELYLSAFQQVDRISKKNSDLEFPSVKEVQGFLDINKNGLLTQEDLMRLGEFLSSPNRRKGSFQDTFELLSTALQQAGQALEYLQFIEEYHDQTRLYSRDSIRESSAIGVAIKEITREIRQLFQQKMIGQFLLDVFNTKKLTKAEKAIADPIVVAFGVSTAQSTPQGIQARSFDRIADMIGLGIGQRMREHSVRRSHTWSFFVSELDGVPMELIDSLPKGKHDSILVDTNNLDLVEELLTHMENARSRWLLWAAAYPKSDPQMLESLQDYFRYQTDAFEAHRLSKAEATKNIGVADVQLPPDPVSVMNDQIENIEKKALVVRQQLGEELAFIERIKRNRTGRNNAVLRIWEVSHFLQWSETGAQDPEFSYYPADKSFEFLIKLYADLFQVEILRVDQVRADGLAFYEIRSKGSEKTLGYFGYDLRSSPGDFGKQGKLFSLSQNEGPSEVEAGRRHVRDVHFFVAPYLVHSNGQKVIHGKSMQTLFQSFGEVLNEFVRSEGTEISFFSKGEELDRSPFRFDLLSAEFLRHLQVSKNNQVVFRNHHLSLLEKKLRGIKNHFRLAKKLAIARFEHALYNQSMANESDLNEVLVRYYNEGGVPIPSQTNVLAGLSRLFSPEEAGSYINEALAYINKMNLKQEMRVRVGDYLTRFKSGKVIVPIRKSGAKEGQSAANQLNRCEAVFSGIK